MKYLGESVKGLESGMQNLEDGPCIIERNKVGMLADVQVSWLDSTAHVQSIAAQEREADNCDII